MRNLGYTVARLTPAKSARESASRLEPLRLNPPNPGGLKAWTYAPEDLAANPALVVVLHGCTQSAAAYDVGSGWSALADRHGFVVLYPEQQRANNPGLCFKWYSPSDVQRGRGEAASIRSAIETAIGAYDIDPSRVFVTGLSAGGAMAAVMLATYPEVFAGGAIIAGLPYGAAASAPEAFDRMRGHGLASASAATAAVLTASGHAGPWPSVSIWHGTADHTVVEANADALIAQWAGVHDLELLAHETAQVAGHRHRIWRDASGHPVLEDYRIVGMGHGVPVDPQGAEPCGQAGPFMLDAGLSSSKRLAAHWKLDQNERRPQASNDGGASVMQATDAPTRDLAAVRTPTSPIQLVIEQALRRAGLMS